MPMQPADPDLRALRCPHCRETPRFERIADGFGIAHCGCGLMPLAAHVLLPQRGQLQTQLLEALRARRLGQAEALILGRHWTKQRLIRALGLRPTLQRFVRHQALSTLVNRLHLRQALLRLPPQRINQTLLAAAQWNDYIRHRFSLPSMLANVPLLGLVRGRSGFVLDAACGMGHLSFLISRLFPANRIVSMDLSPAFAYAAKWFFVPDSAAAMAYDMNHPLPLPDAGFGVIYCADAFQYVADQPGLAKEFLRVLRDDGVCVLAHVHNALQHNSFAGNPKTPAEYAQLFAPHHVRIFPDWYLLEAYVGNEPLDLSRQIDQQELNASPGLVVAVAKDPAALGTLRPARTALMQAARNARVNGMFRLRRCGNEYVFERRIPVTLQEDYPELFELLPPELAVPANLVSHENGRLRFENQRELLEKHVLIDVPENY